MKFFLVPTVGLSRLGSGWLDTSSRAQHAPHGPVPWPALSDPESSVVPSWSRGSWCAVWATDESAVRVIGTCRAALASTADYWRWSLLSVRGQWIGVGGPRSVVGVSNCRWNTAPYAACGDYRIEWQSNGAGGSMMCKAVQKACAGSVVGT